jgi:prepilin-type N-terminal cleavage/methylation domain-containing protein
MQRSGFSLIELLIVVGITIVITTAGYLVMSRRPATTELQAGTSTAVALVREAQQKALTNASSTRWGVRFNNTTSTMPSLQLFASSSYDGARIANYVALPSRISFESTSLLPGATRDIIFATGTGFPVATSSVVLRVRQGTEGFTLTISNVGVVTLASTTVAAQ